jgi:hypothetical protein
MPQTSSFSSQTRPATALPGSFPTNTPKGKGKAPATRITIGPSSSTPNLPAPPIQTSLMPPTITPQAPPLGGNPPPVLPPTPAAPAPAPVPPAPPLPPGGNPPPVPLPTPAAPAPAPVLPAPPLPPGGNPPPVPPPAPAIPMANPPPRAIGSTPDVFDGNPAKAEPFWNALENYYTLNNAVYMN